MSFSEICSKYQIVCLYAGFASAQKVIQLTYCSIDEHHLRMDCRYAVPAESSEVFCKYTQGHRLLDTTDPEEEQHAPFKNRARARIFPGNICRLLFKNLPRGKSNFTCNIKVADSATVSKTSVVETSKLIALRSCYSVSKQNVNVAYLTSYCRAASPVLRLECPVTKLQRPAHDLHDTSCTTGAALAVNEVPSCSRRTQAPPGTLRVTYTHSVLNNHFQFPFICTAHHH